jgi:hypothetical protein
MFYAGDGILLHGYAGASPFPHSTTSFTHRTYFLLEQIIQAPVSTEWYIYHLVPLNNANKSVLTTAGRKQF